MARLRIGDRCEVIDIHFKDKWHKCKTLFIGEPVKILAKGPQGELEFGWAYVVLTRSNILRKGIRLDFEKVKLRKLFCKKQK